MMTNPVPVTDDIDPNKLLDEAADAPLLIERRGVVYKLSRAESVVSKPYDAEAFRIALRNVTGMITPEEARHRQELMRRGRDEGTQLEQ